jgi:DHA2 family multidrug resistance protein
VNNLEYKWQVLIVVIFGSFMVVLDATVMNVTLPTFEQIFHTDISGVQWILTSYLLSLGVATPLAGYLADRFGIKRMYILALGLFVVGSALCGFSQNLPMLIGFRVFQGIGGGLTVPLGTAQLFQAFPEKERGLANGIFGIPLLVAPALGPTLGGALIQFLHWSLIFYINVPIGLAGIGLAIWLLKSPQKENQAAKKKEKLDWPGLILIILGVGLLLFALDQASHLGWTDWLVLGAGGIAIVLLIGFAVIEMRRENPILNLRLFGQRNFSLGSLTNWATVVALFATAFLLPLYLQNVRGESSFTVGLLLLPQAVTAGVAISFTGKLYDKIGPRTLVTCGLIILVGTSWFFTQIRPDTSYLLIEILLALRGLALSLSLQATINTALSVADRAALPRASSLVNANRWVVQALATSILSTVLATQAASEGTGPASGGSGTQVNPQAFVNGLDAAFWVAFWVTLIGFVISFFLPGWPGKWPLQSAQNNKDRANTEAQAQNQDQPENTVKTKPPDPQRETA